jgi:hypothetical protein
MQMQWCACGNAQTKSDLLIDFALTDPLQNTKKNEMQGLADALGSNAFIALATDWLAQNDGRTYISVLLLTRKGELISTNLLSFAKLCFHRF